MAKKQVKKSSRSSTKKKATKTGAKSSRKRAGSVKSPAKKASKKPQVKAKTSPAKKEEASAQKAKTETASEQPTSPSLDFMDIFSLSKQLLRRPKSSLLLPLFDGLFLLTLYFLIPFIQNMSRAYVKIAPNIVTQLFALVLFFGILGLYVFVYSFFKYLVMHALREFTTKEEFSFAYLKEFYFLNLGLSAILTVIVFGVQLLLSPIFDPNAMNIPVALILTVIFGSIGLALFWYVQLSHAHFFKTGQTTFTLYAAMYSKVIEQVGSVFKVFFFSLLCFVLFLLAFALIGLPLKFFYFTNAQNMAYYPLYVNAFSLLATLEAYFLLQVHRLCAVKLAQ